MMLVQPANGTLTEVSAVFIIRLKSENSWDVLALSCCYFIVLFFQLVKFSRGILLKLGEEIWVDVNKFTVFNCTDR